MRFDKKVTMICHQEAEGAERCEKVEKKVHERRHSSQRGRNPDGK